MIRAIGTTLAALLALVASGCGPTGPVDALFDNYASRVARVLELNLPANEPTPPPAYPDKRQRRHLIATTTIDLLDFLRLYGCELQRLVGERNSGLGRVQTASQQLYYDIEFIRLAARCLAHIQSHDPDNTEQQEALQQWLASKQAQLPQVFWNATFGGEEFAELFSRATTPLPPQPRAGQLETLVEALAELHRLQQQAASGPALNRADYERLFQVLQARPYAGQLLQGMARATHWLDRVSALLEARTQESPFCEPGKNNPKVDILQTVFTKFYAGQVQPYISVLHRQGQALFNETLALYQALGQVETTAVARYLDAAIAADNSVRGRFDRAVQRHVLAWQGLLAQCGRLPGAT